MKSDSPIAHAPHTSVTVDEVENLKRHIEILKAERATAQADRDYYREQLELFSQQSGDLV